MSGLEIAGLVLGAIPVAIAALEGYRKCLSRSKGAVAQLAMIQTDLRTEQKRLYIIMRSLLRGMVPPEEIEKLLSDYRNQDWKRWNEEMRLRLWVTYDIVKEEIDNINEAVKDLHHKLAINEEGKAEMTLFDVEEIFEELKTQAKFARFTLKKGEYDKVLDKIKASNSRLAQFLVYDRTDELENRQMSEARLIRIRQELYGGVFEALSKASACSCKDTHSFCLELGHEKKSILPQEKDEEAILGLQPHVIFATDHLIGNCVRCNVLAPTKGNAGTSLCPRRWTSLQLRPRKAEMADEDPSPANERAKRRRLEIKSLKHDQPWSYPVPTSTPQALTSKIPTTIYRDLCRVLSWSQQQKMNGCYGIITSPSRRFEIHPRNPRQDTGICQSLTIRAMLQCSVSNVTILNRQPYELRLRAALRISTGVTYLFGTPWMSDILGLENFLLLCRADGYGDEGSQSIPLESPVFIRQSARRIDRIRSNSEKEPDPQKQFATADTLVILNCGIVLLQLLLGKVLDELGMENNASIDSILDKCQAGLDKAGVLEEQCADQYTAAVLWCFNHVRQTILANKKTRWLTFHREVVVRLEEELRLFQEA